MAWSLTELFFLLKIDIICSALQYFIFKNTIQREGLRNIFLLDLQKSEQLRRAIHTLGESQSEVSCLSPFLQNWAEFSWVPKVVWEEQQTLGLDYEASEQRKGHEHGVGFTSPNPVVCTK